MAFHPPPPSYEFIEHEGRETLLLKDVFNGQPPRPFTPPGTLHVIRDLRTRRSNSIACFYLEQPESLFTIIFSHGNAADLGLMSLFLASLSQQLQCSIFAYDYSGYGRSSGRPREANIYADIAAAYDCVRTRFGVPADRIVLYGQSIGTAATIDLAAHVDVAAIILHSPLSSGLRLLKPNVSRTWCCDPFQSFDKIRRVQCRTMIVHGTHDEVIPHQHGEQLAARCGGPVRTLYVDGAGHNDLELYPAFVDGITDFVLALASGSM